MSYEIKALFRVETTRLLWITGVLFALIVTFQFIELPYGNVLSSSLFPFHKVPAAENTDSEKVANVTHVTGLNSSGVNAPNNNTLSSGFEENDLNHDVVAQTNASSSYQSSTKKLDLRNSSAMENGQSYNNKDEAGNIGIQESVSPKNEEAIHSSNSSSSNISEGNTTLISENREHFHDLGSPLPASDLSPNSVDLGKKTKEIIRNGKVKNRTKGPSTVVISIDGMNNLLRQSHVSYHPATPRWSSAVEQELLYARSQIENAPMIKNDEELYSPLYRNLSMFKRSYALMEEKLKVYVYKEGKRPILHVPFLDGIYASEGWFMRQIETNKKFVTTNPSEAHLFYLPFSSRTLEETLYVQGSHSKKNIIRFLNSYLDSIASKYPFWNRTQGSDHFLVACHDWAPAETRRSHMGSCIRALCNADIVEEGYVFGKDVSLPETYVQSPKNPIKNLGGKPPPKRSILAFYAGRIHGYLRPILLQHWENKDPDMKIFSKMPEGKMNYIQHMKSSKYCICPRGYEVNSPRVVEAIFYECVPVIISNNFVPPFFEVLNWESFAVFVEEKDVSDLKNILFSIPQKRYLQLQLRVKKVQKHFLWHPKPQRYDIFHMILHSIWYNRVFQMRKIT